MYRLFKVIYTNTTGAVWAPSARNIVDLLECITLAQLAIYYNKYKEIT